VKEKEYKEWYINKGMLTDVELNLGETGYRIISRFGVDMSDEDSLKVIEKNGIL
jgi:hypothetical protein